MINDMSTMSFAAAAYCLALEADYAKNYTDKPMHFPKTFSVVPGRKFLKIVMTDTGDHRSVHSFINLTHPKFFPGDILKAASWAAPALNFSRGNVLTHDWAGITWAGSFPGRG